MSTRGYGVDRPRRKHHLLCFQRGRAGYVSRSSSSLRVHDRLEALRHGAGRFGAPIWRLAAGRRRELAGHDSWPARWPRLNPC
jgi:hypothetical protein